MHIERIQLRNYLSHENTDIELCPGINVLIGINGVGKTNLLDSLYMSAVGRSYRYNRDKDLISWDSDQGAESIITVRNRFTTDEVRFVIDMDGKKNIFINGMQISRIAELMGIVNLVMFHPNELKLIKESPVERRRFMDISICQQSKKYFYSLIRYNQYLEQRNKILKNYKGQPLLKSILAVTTKNLVRHAEVIMRARRDFINEILPYAKENHTILTKGAEILDIIYESEKIDYDNFQQSYEDLLELSLEKDENLGYTTVGPHRDDIKITCNNIDMRKHGSQGQQRTIVLSLKLAEIKFYEKRLNEPPILILDDVLAELDVDRRNTFCSAIQGIQTIVASTEVPINIQGGRVFRVDKETGVTRER